MLEKAIYVVALGCVGQNSDKSPRHRNQLAVFSGLENLDQLEVQMHLQHLLAEPMCARERLLAAKVDLHVCERVQH